MKRTIVSKTAVIISVILFPVLVFASKPPDDVQKARIMNNAYRMSVPFIENRGQIENKDVNFYAKTFGGTLFVERDGTLTYSFPGEDKTGVVIKEVITDKKVKVKGLDPSPTKVNYFKGKDQSKWKTNIPSYNSVSLGEIYKGVNLELKAYGNNVEKLFTVSPGENPELIKVKLEGAKELKLNENGELEVITEHGPIKFTKPIAYQEINGKRTEVNVSYNIQGLGDRGQGTGENDKIQMTNVKLTNSSIPKSLNPQSDTPTSHIPDPFSSTLNPEPLTLFYGFKVASYNKKYPLIIDPLLASTFLGGGSIESGWSITLDGSGNVYVTGNAQSGFPTISGAYEDNYNGGSWDVFVSKLDSNLSSLLASTFIGGGSSERGYSIALDGSDNVFVTGITPSSDYPTTPGAYDEDYNGGYDVFVSKLNSDLSSLLASTFIGGGSSERGDSLTLDGSGNVYVSGYAGSGYPTTLGAYDETHNGGWDVFVSKLDNNLSSLSASTFIGGGSDEGGYSIALDGSDNVYVTGYAQSGFPTTLSAYDEIYNGGDEDVFVSKLDNNLSSLSASTFIGGSSDDVGRSIALDGAGNVYLTGKTWSSDYPTTSGAYDESDNGIYDVFVSRLNSDLSSLSASTFIGGSGTASGWSIALDGSGNVYIAGSTSSSDYPTTSGAYDESINGGVDVFVSKLDNNLTTLSASTFIGGGLSEESRSLALDGSGNVYVTGSAHSGFPTTSGAYDESHNGNYNVFISKLNGDLSSLSASTFISGSSSDSANSLALDGSGNVYVTGEAQSGFPTTSGAYDENYNGGDEDVFVSKLDSSLSTLLASTFIGGVGSDEYNSLSLDKDGNVYITGRTSHSDYPTTPGAYDESFNGGTLDVFVSKLNSDLSSLLASTFIGGGGGEGGESIVIDESGIVYIYGWTNTAGYPTTPGAYDESFNGGILDVFVSKLDSNLSSLLASTFIGGGDGNEFSIAMTIDASGNIYLTGTTESSDYPTTPGAYDESFNPGGSQGRDVFVSKLNNDLSSLVASTFIGGSSDDSGWSIALDGSGNVYVTGYAGSDYPTTPGAYDENFNSGVFVSKLNSDLSTLLASTYIGKGYGYSLALDGCGNVYLTGYTYSSDYPTTPGAYDESFNGGSDVFVSMLDNSLSFLFKSTYIGGSGYDYAEDMALDRSGNVYVTGDTGSSDYPTTAGAYDETLTGGYGIFISKLDSILSSGSGFASGTSGFLADNGVSFAFDADGDGVLDVGCVNLLLCEGQIVEVDIWVTGWDSIAEGDVESIDYYFNWDPDLLEVQSVSCNSSLWDSTCNEPTPPGSGEFHLQVSSSSGVPGPDMKLHTITLKVKDLPSPTNDHIVAGLGTGGFIDPVGGSNYTNVANGDITIDTICGAEPLECNEEDHCEMLSSDDICPDTANPDSDNGYELLEEGTTFCEGEMINVIHTSLGSYTAYIVGQIDNMCSSVCFNECFNDCAYVEQQGCYLNCVKGCTNGVCPDWDEPEVCNEYQNRIDCNIACYNDCYYSYDGETHTSHYDKRCGFPVHEIITVKVDAGNDCEGDLVSEYELTGTGAAAISIPLPLAAGSYDICAGTTLIETVTVQNCGEPVCTLSIPTNFFLADQGIDNSLSVTLSNIDAGGNYSLSLKRWENDEHTIPMDIPTSLSVPAQTSVAENGSISFDLDALDPQTVDGQSHWANVIIWAEGSSTSCGASFDFDIRNISARADCGSDDYFSQSETVYGRAFLGLDTGTSYPLYVVDETSWTDGMTIPSRVSGTEASFTTDGSGDMACGTVIWSNVQADPLPAQFDIVIDVNSNGLFNEGTDYLDGKTGAGFGIYTDTDDDGVPDIEDNCWEVSNPYQLDSDGDCPDPPYTSDPQCGDICEPANQCQADFDNDGNVYPSDLSVFLDEYGRTDCLTNPPCQADFDGDGNVYPSDLSVFLDEYGRTNCLE